MITIPFKDVAETLENLSPFCSLSYEDNLGQKHLLTKTPIGYIHATSGMGSVHITTDKSMDIEQIFTDIEKSIPRLVTLFRELDNETQYTTHIDHTDADVLSGTTFQPISKKKPAPKKAAAAKKK